MLLACGLVEITSRRADKRTGSTRAAIIAVVGHAVALGGFGSLAWVAFKVGALSYGGGFVIVPLMQHDAVTTYHWMTGTQFLNAVALGQVTPGPVVLTTAVVGYAARGLRGGLFATLIAFAPSFAFVLLGAPRFDRLRANQVIHFAVTPQSHRVGDTAVLSASGGDSGSPVVFAIDASSASVCTITSGSTLNFVGAGNCVIHANEAGNADYNPAPEITRTISVNLGEQDIHFTSTPPVNPRVGGTYKASASGGASGNQVIFTIAPGSTSSCTLAKDGTTVSFVKAGACTIRANQAGNANYESAGQVSQSFTIEKSS